VNTPRVLLAVSFGVALAAACGGSTSGNDGGAGGGGGSSGAGGATSSGGAVAEGGIPCGQTSCVAPQVCCYAGAGGPEGGNVGFGPPIGSCTDSCDAGVQIGCTSAAQCSNSEVCCGSVASAGPPGSFNAACAAKCPATAFQLCASAAECRGGDMCMGEPGFMFCSVPFEAGSLRRDGGGVVTADAASPADGG